MKKIKNILIALVLCFIGMVNLPVDAESVSEIDYPVNPMIAPFNNTLLISWINPSGLSKTELYSVDDYTDTLITDKLFTNAGEAVEYEASNLENGVDYSYRIKFYYQSGETYSVFLSERPFEANPEGVKVIGKWVVQPGRIPFKMNIDRNVGYDDNSSIHVSVNREKIDYNERMYLRYDARIPAGTYVVRARLKYNEASGATIYAYNSATSMELKGTSDEWVLFEKTITLPEEKPSVFYVNIYSKTKDLWIDNFEIHEIVDGVEQTENLAKNISPDEIMASVGEVTVPNVSVQGGNSSARVMWNMYSLTGCRINIYDKESGALAASANSTTNSILLRDLSKGTHTFVVKTENRIGAELENGVEVSVYADGNEVAVSSEFVNYSLNNISWSNGHLYLKGGLLSKEYDESISLTLYKHGKIAALEQRETDNNGEFEFYFPLGSGDYTMNIASTNCEKESVSISIQEGEIKYNDIIDEIDTMRDNLKALLDACAEKGISTDYETIAWRIIERDSEYFRQDVYGGQNLEWDKRFEALCKLYAATYETLEKYLSGEKTPLNTVRYITGENGINENNFYGQTTEGERPVYYMGYQTEPENVQYMKDLGFNYAAIDVAHGYDIVTYGAAPYWAINKKTEDVYLTDSGLVMNGNNAVSQFVNLKAGESVSFGMGASTTGEYVIKLGASTNGTYTAQKDEILKFVISNTSGETVIENAYVMSNDVNILKNPDFKMQDELFDKYNYIVSMDNVYTTKNALEKAEEDGIVISLNLSLGRIPAVVKEDPETTSNGAVHINPTHPKYLNACEVYLKAFFDECGNSPALHDVIIYNEPTFFANKSTYYNEAWQEYIYENAGMSKDTAMPSDDDKDSVLYTWYMRFNDSILTEFHKTVAEYIRKYCDTVLIHTKIMQYIRPAYGSYHTSISNDYESWAQYLDVNGCDAFSLYFLDGYMPLSTQEAWYDYMRSVKKAPVINSEDHIILDTGEGELLTYNETELEHVKATMWQGAFHGRGASAVWMYQRDPYRLYMDGGQHLYTNSNISLRPDVQYELGKIALNMNKLSNEISYFANNKKQVAILFSPVSLNYEPGGMHVMTQAYDALLYMGIGAEFVAEGRMDNLDDYEMLIVPRTICVSDDAFSKIKAYAQNGGKVYIVGSAFQRDENGNSKYRWLTGDNVKKIASADLTTTLRNAVVENIDRKLVVTDAEGNASDYVEYSSADNGIYRYINLCNHSGETKNVILSYSGNSVGDAVDFISGEAVNGASIMLAPYQTMLIRVENIIISAEIIEEVSGDNTHKATFNISGSTDNEDAMLIFASYDEDGCLNDVETVIADLAESATKLYELRIKATPGTRVICMAINSKSYSLYMNLVEL